MRVLLQRVRRGVVRVDEQVVGQIGRGLVLLAGFHRDDGDEQVRFCAEKCANLRVFADGAGRMNLSLRQVGGQALVVSQFTLYGQCRKGRRPSYEAAAPPPVAAPLYARFLDVLAGQGIDVESGVFGAYMQVEIHNDGPVTLLVESPS